MRLKEKQLYLTCEALGTRPNQVELFNLAQRVGFEPTDSYLSTDFESVPL